MESKDRPQKGKKKKNKTVYRNIKWMAYELCSKIIHKFTLTVLAETTPEHNQTKHSLFPYV